jgi:hypothetical protein
MKFADVWASFMILLYPIGIPLLYFWLLYKNRYDIIHRYDAENRATVVHANSQQPNIKMFKFLYDSYKPQYWYFEIIETSRRLMLTGALSVTDAGASGQVVFGIIIAVFYMKIYAYYQPYELEESSIVAELAQYQIFFSFFGSLVIQNNILAPSYNNLIGGLMIVLNLSATLLSIYYEYRTSLKEMDDTPDTEDTNAKRSTSEMEMTETPNPLFHRIDVNTGSTSIVSHFVDKYIKTVAATSTSECDDSTTNNSNSTMQSDRIE